MITWILRAYHRACVRDLLGLSLALLATMGNDAPEELRAEINALLPKYRARANQAKRWLDAWTRLWPRRTRGRPRGTLESV